MKTLVITALVMLMTGHAISAVAVNAAGVKVAVPGPIEVSIARPGDAQSDGALHAFAMACGILAFAAAVQQALSRGRLAGIRVKPEQD